MSRPSCGLTILGFTLAAALAGCTRPSASDMQITLQLQPQPGIRTETAVAQARATIRKRLDELGLSDAAVETVGTDRLSIRFPNVEDPERVRRVLLSDAVLELRLVRFPALGADLSSEDAVLSHFQGQLPSDLEILKQEVRGEGGQVTEEKFFAVEKKPVITGRDIAAARPGTGQIRQPIVVFRLKPEAADIFSEVTGANVGSRIAIVLDGRVASAPMINSRIGDTGIIEGGFTPEQALELAITLNSGPLPAGLTVVEAKRVGPSQR